MRYILLTTITITLNFSRYVDGTLVSSLGALGLSSGTQIALSSNSSNFTQRWSTYDEPDFIVAIKPVTDHDVAKIVGFAANSSTPFLTTGGGHGFATTLGRLQHGIELDMSNFNTVNVDADANTMTIGGAARFRDVLGPLGAARKEIHEAIGSENCVGMVGSTLGGGVGRYNGLHGMILDSLQSVKIVTAAGQIVTASTTKDSDLFWGIRGAGFNFGTVLEATYTIYDQTAPQVLNADFLFGPNASLPILQFFKSFEQDGLPAKLSFVFLGIYEPALGGSAILINAVYAGSQEEAMPYIQPLINLSPTLSNLTMISWSDINSAALFGIEPANYTCPAPSSHNVYGSAVSYFDIPTFQNFYQDYSSVTSSMAAALNGTVYFIEFFPKQAVLAVQEDATAYPWRNITAHLLFNFAYTDTTGAIDAKINAFAQQARANFTAVNGFPQDEIYVLYGHGDEDQATLYSAKNLPRLKALKAQWDPLNVYKYTYPLF
ncbi:MAG: hypothetical protein M1820_007064 [Bogoriella megaspora]|nr:MAG: hypothetical protein M1820_007064 [Bogoriella megaspora]